MWRGEGEKGGCDHMNELRGVGCEDREMRVRMKVEDEGGSEVCVCACVLPG